MIAGFGLATTGLSALSVSAANAADTIARTVTVCADGCDFTTITDGIADASAGDIVSIAAGTYSEKVTVDKGITLRGALDDAGMPTTVIKGTGNPGLRLSSGTPDSPLVVENIKVEGFTDGIWFGSYTTLNHVHSVNNEKYGLRFRGDTGQTFTDVIITDSVASGNDAGLKLASTDSADGVTVLRSHFDDNNRGWYSDGNGSSELTNVEIIDTTFNGNTVEGFYTERLSNASFKNVSATNIGPGQNDEKPGKGFSINLKGASENITFENVSVEGSPTGDLGSGDVGIHVMAETEKSGSLDGLSIRGGSVTDTATGIIIGGDGISSEPEVSNVNLAGNGVAVQNDGGPAIDASLNYWGDSPNFGALVSGDVTYLPYWASSAMTPIESKVNLTAPTAVVAGNEFTVTANVNPGTSQGDVELYNGSTLVNRKALTNGKASFTLQYSSAGSRELHAVFVPAEDGPKTEGSTSATVSVQVNKKKTTPAPPPASDSEQLERDIADGKVTLIPPTEFKPTPDIDNSSPSNINPAIGLSGTIPWSDDTDSFVDVYVYSTPVFLGTFPVVNGEVQLNLTPSMLAKLESGSHQIVFIGQTSGTTQAMAVSIQQTGSGSGVAETGSGSGVAETGSGGVLAETGFDGAATLPVIALAGLLMLVGTGAVIAPSLLRRFSRR